MIQLSILIPRGLLLCCLFFLLKIGNVVSQEPFICNGDYYLSLTSNGPSVIYSVGVDPQTNEILFNPVSGASSGAVINAIGFRSTDNFIYGVDPDAHILYRVDASGMATALATLDELNASYQYFAGEIDAEGNYLYLLGSGGNPYYSRDFVRVDLETYAVSTTAIPNASSASAFITDFSFDPISGILYGFDRNDNRLVTIDPVSGVIDETLFSPSFVSDAMGAIFFDAFGNLFGYGDLYNTNISNTLFRIDKTNGMVSVEATGPVAIGKDACACPYTVELQKTVYPEVTFPCTEVVYAFEVANASALPVTDAVFTDMMPDVFTITEIISNPFGGEVISGVGSSMIHIEAMTIPQGIDSILVRVEIGQDALGIYANQAVLENLPTALGSQALSDDPETLFVGDSTLLEVIPLFVDLPNDTIFLCTGNDILLDVSSYGVTYLWNDGSSNATLTTSGEGLYWVEVSSACETVFDSVLIIENDLAIDLGPDLTIQLGDSVLLNPSILGSANLSWTDPLENSLSCTFCPNPFARPFFDVQYTLSGTDGFGCTDVDSMRITVLKDRAIYIPNTFTPNEDGFNDIFYIQGKGFGIIRRFTIYDRWGRVVFNQSNGYINDRSFGWDGRSGNENYNNAVFVYLVEIEYLDGIMESFSGDLTLVR